MCGVELPLESACASPMKERANLGSTCLCDDDDDEAILSDWSSM